MKKLFFLICLSLFYLVFVVSADEGHYQSKNMLEVGGMQSDEKVWSSLVGSAPPNCAGVCMRCKPCKPVLVTVPPPPSAEGFYPQAWRCECRGVLYKPPKSPKPSE